MQFYESLLTDESPAGLVEVDTNLFLRLMSSFRRAGNRAEIDLESLEALYTDTVARSRRKTSRIVVLDGCRVFIDGVRVHGLTRLGIKVLSLLSERGGETTRDDLAINVWGDADISRCTIPVFMSRLNETLEHYGCWIECSRLKGCRLRFLGD